LGRARGDVALGCAAHSFYHGCGLARGTVEGLGGPLEGDAGIRTLDSHRPYPCTPNGLRLHYILADGAGELGSYSGCLSCPDRRSSPLIPGGGLPLACGWRREACSAQAAVSWTDRTERLLIRSRTGAGGESADTIGISAASAGGALIARTDGKGQTAYFDYDESGRQVRALYALVEAVYFAYDLSGNRTLMQDEWGASYWTYDVLGRPTDWKLLAKGKLDGVAGGRVRYGVPILPKEHDPKDPTIVRPPEGSI